MSLLGGGSLGIGPRAGSYVEVAFPRDDLQQQRPPQLKSKVRVTDPLHNAPSQQELGKSCICRLYVASSSDTRPPQPLPQMQAEHTVKDFKEVIFDLRQSVL